MALALPPDCFSARLAQVGRHVDRGEWASGHALVLGLRACSLRHGCPDGESCAVAAELLMGDLRGLVRDRDRNVAVASQP